MSVLELSTFSLIQLLTKHNLTLTTCESLTGGFFAANLTKIPGSGQIFKGGLVVYTNQAKINLVQLSPLTLQKYGAISSKCAQEMALNTQRLLETDLAISFTGNAGPTGQENKAVGMVFIGLAFKEKLISKSYQFKGSRKEIREKTVQKGIELIKNVLNKN